MQHADAADASQNETGHGDRKRIPNSLHSPQKLASVFQRRSKKFPAFEAPSNAIALHTRPPRRKCIRGQFQRRFLGISHIPKLL